MKFLLFESVHRVMEAERLLIEAAIPYELLPTPKEYSSECGMCIRVDAEYLNAALNLLGNLAFATVNPPESVSDNERSK